MYISIIFKRKNKRGRNKNDLSSYKIGVVTGEAGEEDFETYIEEIPGSIEKTTDTTYTIKVDNRYEFIVKKDNLEIQLNGSSSNAQKTSYSIGDTVTLIAKYNLGKSKVDGKWKQAPNATTGNTACAFSSTNYWKDDFTSDPFDLNDLGKESEGDAIAKAKEYAKR